MGPSPRDLEAPSPHPSALFLQFRGTVFTQRPRSRRHRRCPGSPLRLGGRLGQGNRDSRWDGQSEWEKRGRGEDLRKISRRENQSPSAQRGENWCGAFSVGAGTGTGRGWPGGASAGGGRAAARTAGGQLPLRPHFPSGSTELGSQSKDRNRHAVVSLRVLQGSRVKGMLASLERFIVQVWLTFLERLAGLESAGWGSQAETREGLLLRFRPNVISLDTQGRASAGGLVP